LCAAGTQFHAGAVPVTIDQILANAPAGLAGSLDIAASVNNSVLTIALKNASVSAEIGANVLLTGLAFQLPAGLSIDSGTVSRGAGSSFVNFAGTQTDVSGEWGFGNSAQGHFTGLAVDALISTMVADSEKKFSATPLSNPAGLSGPDFGLISATGNAGGVEAIKDAILITLKLKGSYTGDLPAAINGGLVAATFGSPEAVSVPEGGATLVLMGLGLFSLFGYSCKTK